MYVCIYVYMRNVQGSILIHVSWTLYSLKFDVTFVIVYLYIWHTNVIIGITLCYIFKNFFSSVFLISREFILHL